jgi:hypothetical protein
MQAGILIPAALVAGLVYVTLCPKLPGQKPAASTTPAATQEIPEAPRPRMAPPADGSIGSPAQWAEAQDRQQPSPSTPTFDDGTQSSSNAQAPVPPPLVEKSQYEKAEEQLKQQEKQRVMGVMATFNTTQNRDAVPLSSGQKFRLFFRSATDPWPFLLTGVVAGIGQAQDSHPEWGQGMEGYAKRFGAGYGDYFIGNFFGNAVLTSLWKEDPRYFQKGKGRPIKRFLWAAASTVWCKRDNGTWGPNYANVGGNMIGAAIARAYYPPSGRTVGDTITDGLTVTVEGAIGAEVIEFWPDMVRHYRQKQAEKQARARAEADRNAAGQKTKDSHE